MNGDTATVVTLVRQAVELGADVIKADPTDRLDDYPQVIAAAGDGPCSCAAAGACPTRSCSRARVADGHGAAGIVYGRNVIQHEDPAGITRALMAIVHG